MIYVLFKFVHVAAVIVWVGGLVALSVVNARLASEKDGAVLATMARQSGLYGRTVIGPSILLALVAGIVMMAVSGLGAPFWILWGFIALIGSWVLGAVFMSRIGARLSELAPTVEPGNTEVAALQRRLRILNAVNMMLLISAVWVMVAKPTL